MNERTISAAEDTSGEEAGQPAENPEPESSHSTPARQPLLSRVAGLFKYRNGPSLRDNLTDALAETAGRGEEDFSPAERAMLNNILRLREVRVEDVMVPRAEVEAVDINTTLGDLMVTFEQSGHSRMPVYSETLDDPRGMVHIRDVVAHLTRICRQKKRRPARKQAGTAKTEQAPEQRPGAAGELDLAKVDLGKTIGELNLVRPLLFVPPSMLASDLMARMQTAHIQMALVIDEYGGTDGLASLEDIVEMVVGDIEDEHDEDEALITRAGDGVFLVDGKAEIDDVAEMIGEAFKPGEHNEDVDTIGGMIFNTLGRVPARGEVVQAIPGFEFHVIDADPRRIKRVRIVQTRTTERRRRAAKTAA